MSKNTINKEMEEALFKILTVKKLEHAKEIAAEVLDVDLEEYLQEENVLTNLFEQDDTFDYTNEEF